MRLLALCGSRNGCAGNGGTSAGDNGVDAGGVSTPELTPPGHVPIRPALGGARQPDSTATSKTVAALSSIRAPNTSPVIPPPPRQPAPPRTPPTPPPPPPPP